MSITERLDWSAWLVPRKMRQTPVHRWFVFPHSYSRELVEALCKEWGLGRKDRLLDPFVGAGTTLVEAMAMGIKSVGYDLSPLAVFCGRVKTSALDASELEKAWLNLEKRVAPGRWHEPKRAYPILVKAALGTAGLSAFDTIRSQITRTRCTLECKDALLLALLRTLPSFSTLVASGGWLKRVRPKLDVSFLPIELSREVATIIADSRAVSTKAMQADCEVGVADARALPCLDGEFTAVITSPPYPNRHDYTRVFGLELLFAFVTEEEAKAIRRESLHSHPEARPLRHGTFEVPHGIEPVLNAIRVKKLDTRIGNMLIGYLHDMQLCLSEMARVTVSGARIALIVGNAQYAGEPVLVDELVAEIGERVGLHCSEIRIARYRGNSAQQMALYGRKPSRESVVLFRKPSA